MPKAPNFPSLSTIDPRLRLAELRVLGAVFYFYQPGPDMAPFDRKRISDLIGMHERNISLAAQNLEAAGWLLRLGDGRGKYVRINWENSLPNPDQIDQRSDSETLINTISDGANPDHIDQGCGSERGSNRSGFETYPDHPDQRSDAEAATDDLSNKEIEIGSSRDIDLSTYLPIDRMSTSPIKYGEAFALLKQAGMPDQYHNTKNGQQKDPYISSWITKGVTVNECCRAIERAQQFLKPGRAIGPKYLDGCINTIRSMNDGKASQSAGGFTKGDSIGDDFLSRHNTRTAT